MAGESKTVEDRLWTVLLASSDWRNTVKVANRVRMNDATRQQSPQKQTAKAPADLVEMSIDRGRSRYSPFNKSVTFGTFGTGPCPRIEEKLQDYVITFLSDDQGSVKATEAEELTVQTIVAAGPQLGLPLIVKLVQDITSENRLTNQGIAAGRMRRVITVTVSVLMRFAV
jgi:hypothetical protein